MRVCPDWRCAELNTPDATHCHACGTQIVFTLPADASRVSVPEPMADRQCLGVED